jgi:hypothetical protein
LRIIAAHKQKILAAERIGKHKTISQIVAILVSLACLSLGEFGLRDAPLTHALAVAQWWLYLIALLITVYSGATYFLKNSAMLGEAISDPPEGSIAPEQAPAVLPTVDSRSGGAPAFKEWEAIVEVLGRGAQIILLRKGGIAEGRAGFKPKHQKFWLFPTCFHQQWEKTKPELRHYLKPASAEAAKQIELTYFAEITDAIYLSNWEQVERLRDVHFWGEEILRERFGYHERPGMESGLHLLIVRVSRINLPHLLAPSPAFEGCKSWIEVPVDWTQDIATPVVRTEEFATRRSQILAAVTAPIIAAA